jgi:hypothetical protein
LDMTHICPKGNLVPKHRVIVLPVEGFTEDMVARGAFALARLDIREELENPEGSRSSFSDKSRTVLEAVFFKK